MALDLRRARVARPWVWWGGIAGATVVLAVLTLAVATEWGPLRDLDDAVAQWAYDISAPRPGLVDALDLIAWISTPMYVRVLLLAVAVVLVVRRHHRLALWLVVSVLVQWLVVPASKLLLERPRPEWDEPLHVIGQWSYPSGHAGGAGLFVAAATLLTAVLVARGAVRLALSAVWLVLGLVVVLDRIFLGVHYLSDVVAGFGLGGLIVTLVWVLVMQGIPEPRAAVIETGTGARRLAVVYNPIKVGDADAFEHLVRSAAAETHWRTPTFYPTEKDDPGRGMAELALAAGADMVLVAGGDGTVRIVGAELARTGVALGIVPLGTGNLLARNLGIPLHPSEALWVALRGQDRAVDIVTYDPLPPDDDDAPVDPTAGDPDVETVVEGTELTGSTAFTVMAGLGLDAAIMTGAPDELKARMGWLAYVVSGVRQLRFPAVRISIKVDDGPVERHRVRTVLVGNVGQLQGGFPLLPDARIDDGVLDVVVIAPKSAFSWVRLAVRLVTRRRRSDERLARFTGRRVEIRADRPTPQQLDGDAVGEARGFVATVQPGVLLVRVPARS